LSVHAKLPVSGGKHDPWGKGYERLKGPSIQWQAGDMVTLDNMLVAHARDPFVGERKILVALGDMITDAEVARINQQRAQA